MNSFRVNLWSELEEGRLIELLRLLTARPRFKLMAKYYILLKILMVAVYMNILELSKNISYKILVCDA